jgi:RNA polymerase sigma-70 factor (ECF subfamily)
MADSDAELVARLVAADDRAAFGLLVKRYQSPVRQFFRRLTRNDTGRADDLAQETFLKVFRAIGSFHGQAKFTTWLYRVAYNTFLDDQRNRVPTAPLEVDAEVEAPDFARQAGNEADFDRLLLRLNDRQKAIFDLHYRKDMSHSEIVDALQIPLGTVKSDLSRGLEQLRLLVAPVGNSHE